ncbi:hypothetical protein HRK28_06910 [Rathayibacter sp. VKM Ac-2835]|jgi:hypothetical protein|uniref:hypothetical protein n=1 Tax=Rathayibacter sp. VKM Ac-2835 TaxID=2739043 RepID=UPI0015644005|nr:hypothetical protein [Rathayibacter sp. VKM Ac-2835]NRG40650.1 hypothetical protein [Rathayibacter sp. VKM Ac-2835]
MSQRSSGSTGPTRRSLTAGAVWSIPVVSAAVAAPLAAASPATCRSTVVFPPAEPSVRPPVLRAVAPSGAISSVRIASDLSPGTTSLTQGQDFNLGWDGGRWTSSGDPSAVAEVVVRDYPAGSLMLNQRRAGPITEDPEPGSDRQTLTFTFTGADGRMFDPTDVELSIQNITSGATPRSPWLTNWWSTVGFSVEPGYISTQSGQSAIGLGTVDKPFRRATPQERPGPGAAFVDTFTFRSFPSGSTLSFSQYAGVQGWHAIALSGLSFVSRDC